MSASVPTIDELIIERQRLLGLDDRALARVMNPRKVSKTIRRLIELKGGRADLPDHAAMVARALDLAPADIATAIAETKRLHLIECDRRWADFVAGRVPQDGQPFVPHAVWLSAQTRPSCTFTAVLAGLDRILRLDYPAGLAPGDRLAFALEQMPRRIVSFGACTGVALNEAPDRAVLHDRDGRVVVVRASAVHVGLGRYDPDVSDEA